MKKNNNGNTILALVTSLLAIISICVLFADAFGDDAGPVWGTGFETIFGYESRNTVFCTGLFIAFLCDCLVIFLPFASFFVPEKGRGPLYLLIGVIGIAGATLALFAKPFFIASNTGNVFVGELGTEVSNSLTLGTAFITNAVFMYLSAALCLIGAYTGRNKKKDED